MKTLVQHKLPIRKMFKNLFTGADAGNESSQTAPISSANASNLPTPQPITTDTVEHAIGVEINDVSPIHHENHHDTHLELDSLETWSSHDETTDAPATSHHLLDNTPEAAEDLPQYLALSRVLREQLDTIPECQAVAYVNISSNQLLAFETRQSWAEAVQPLIAAATSDLFLAPNTAKMINAFRKLREKSFDEVNYHQIIISADNVTYVLLRAQNRRDRVAVFACRDSVALGMVLHHAHHALPKIEAAEDSPD